MNTYAADICSMFSLFARRLDLGLDREPPQLDPPPVMVPLSEVVVPDKTGLGTHQPTTTCERGAYHRNPFGSPGRVSKLDPALDQTIALLRKRRQLEKEGRAEALRLFFRSHPAHKLIKKKGTV